MMREARKKYNAHKGRAKQDGIPFLLTFDEWWSIWQASGHFGDTRWMWMMTRHNDEGGYVLGNVKIASAAENAADRDRDKRRTVTIRNTKRRRKKCLCQACERAFMTPRRDARFCSPACKQWAYRSRQVARDVTENGTKLATRESQRQAAKLLGVSHTQVANDLTESGNKLATRDAKGVRAKPSQQLKGIAARQHVFSQPSDAHDLANEAEIADSEEEEQQDEQQDKPIQRRPIRSRRQRERQEKEKPERRTEFFPDADAERDQDEEDDDEDGGWRYYGPDDFGD